MNSEAESNAAISSGIKKMNYNAELIAEERSRIEREYRRRENEIDKDLYAPWQPAENFIVAERKRIAAGLLRQLGKFPQKNEQCLEIGYGKLGWLADLLSWGLKESDLHGIELDADRALIAQQALPQADLRVGDATQLPWENETFDFVCASTVFSSILNFDIRQLIIAEITRVLKIGGVLIWYDLALNNPKNPHVKGINAKLLKEMFVGYETSIKSVTLAPPITRIIAPKSFALTTILSAFPFLRTHLAAILIKKG